MNDSTFSFAAADMALVLSSSDEDVPLATSFAEYYDRYVHRVFTYMRYRVADIQTAEDLTAQVFEHALLHLANYQPRRAPFAAWLFGIAHHVVSRHHRKRRRFFSLPLHESVAEAGLPPETAAIQDEQQQALLRAIHTLSARERDIIALKFVVSLSHKEIARMVGVSERNVGVIVYRVLAKLRQQLGAADE